MWFGCLQVSNMLRWGILQEYDVTILRSSRDEVKKAIEEYFERLTIDLGESYSNYAIFKKSCVGEKTNFLTF